MKKPWPSPLLPLAALALVLALLAAGASADNIDPSNNGSKYAYGENLGWFNAKPANCSGCGVTVTDTKLLGYMWGENIGWVNLNCQNDASCGGAAGAWGVTNDGAGHLSGYAWGENIGWISFSCQNNPSSCAATGNYGVTISPTTGVFSGRAWGENIGWITFSAASPVAYQVRTGWPDSDGDGYTDGAEALIGTNPYKPCGGDGWPSNVFDSGTSANKLDVQDLVSFIAPIRHLNTSPGNPNYSARWDLVPGKGIFPEFINVQDMTALIAGTTGSPPMFNGQRAFNKVCPFPP